MKKIYVVSDYRDHIGFAFAYLDDVSKVKPVILNHIKELIDYAENNETKQEVDREKKRYEIFEKLDFLEMDIGDIRFPCSITIECVALR